MQNYEGFGNYMMPGEVRLKDFQNKLLEIFLYFRNICEENNLTYWCGGGTMLGSVRHKGFIPWDDDLDVFMPREDYEKLYQIWSDVADTSHYVLVRTDEKHNYHHTAMNMVDITTTYINKHSINEDIYHGIYIDVIPFEGCPKSKWKRAVQIFHSIMYSVYNVQRLPDNQGKLLKIPTKILLGLVKNQDKRYKIWKKHELAMTKYPFKNSKYVKETVTSFRALFYVYPREIFELIDAPFENTTVKILKGYDTYMTRIYGDYMSVPQNLDMSSRYNVVEFVDLNKSYLEYRGIKYMVKE